MAKIAAKGMSMPGLSDSQLSVIMTLIETAPDNAIRSLDTALAAETRSDGPMAEIRDLVSTEAQLRRARNLIFGPVVELCPSSVQRLSRRVFPSLTVRKLWRALQASSPQEVEDAVAQSTLWAPDDPVPPVFDALVMAAAAGLRNSAGTPFADVAQMLDEHETGGAEVFATYLDLVPLARDAIAKLPDWLGRMTGERAAAVRLVFRDATDIASDAAPRLFEILAARLKEPWQILRVISAVMDRPQDAFLAASEIGYLGERILEDVDVQFNALKSFDPTAGPVAGVAAAEAARLIVLQITELEQNVDVKRDGPWGVRIAKVKTLTAQTVDGFMDGADKALSEALPLKPSKMGRFGRGSPRFDSAPKAEAVARAGAFLAFIEQNRSSASAGGFANSRSKTVEKLDDRLDRYVEDVLDHLRDDAPEDEAQARVYLDLAADMIGLLRDEKAAQIVRRRGAA